MENNKEDFYKKYTIKQFLSMIRTMPENDFKKIKLSVFNILDEENVKIYNIERNSFDKNLFEIIINTDE